MQAEPLRGPRDVPFLSDRNEVAKLPQLHWPYLKGNDYGLSLIMAGHTEKGYSFVTEITAGPRTAPPGTTSRG